MTEEVQPNCFYVKDGTTRRIVKVLSVSNDTVTFNWMGITFTKPIEDFCRQYTYISVPAMGNAQ